MHPMLTKMRDDAYEAAGAGWRITHDHTGGRWFETSGPRTAPPESEWKPVRFRLWDDDGELYYSGVLNDDDDCVSQQAALEWGEVMAGATVIKVLRDGEWIQEIG